MKKLSYLLTGMTFLFIMIFLSQCSKKEEPALTVSTMTAGDADLNGATAPTGVSPDATISVAFSTNIDQSSVTDQTVVMKRDYDDSVVAITTSVSGNTLTITPTETLGSGTKYRIDLFSTLMSTGGKSLGQIVERSFTTAGSFAPSGEVAYWNFEGNADDQTGNFNASSNGVVDITYAPSRNDSAGQAASFNGTTSIIEIPNAQDLINTNDFTLCFWVKAVSDGHVDADGNQKGQFVMGLGGALGFEFEIDGAYATCKMGADYKLANGNPATEDLWFSADGNLGFSGWTYCQDLSGSGGLASIIKDQWAFVTCVYNSTTKIGTMYINGAKRKEQDFNKWPAGDPKQGVTGMMWGGSSPQENNVLAFGFIHDRTSLLFSDQPWGNYSSQYANHFKGMLDDVRIYHKALSAKEVSLMYNSEK